MKAKSNLLIYGAYGFVGRAITNLAVRRGFRPILAGRSHQRVKEQADGLGLDYQVFELRDKERFTKALKDVRVVLNCAGPYIYTYQSMLEACLETGTHYLDISGEIQVYQEISKKDELAKEKGIILLPGAGFDVVPTDCLAVHLHKRLPTATSLTLAFQTIGPARIPPGTASTLIEILPQGNLLRQNGKLIQAASGEKSRMVNFGDGAIKAIRITWGDIFTAYHSTGIPNIENYIVIEDELAKLLKTAHRYKYLLKSKTLRNTLKKFIPTGSTIDERTLSFTKVWGEVKDPQGRKAVTRLYGPEASVDWTADCALLSIEKVLKNNFKAGYQTPGSAFGPDFVMECNEVVREDVI